MFWLTIQTALLILAAFILGAVLGCIARQFFANARTRATGTDPARAAPAPMTATAAAARAAARTTDAEAGAAGEVVAADSGAAPAEKAETAVTEVAAPVAATAAGDAEPAGAESAEAETAATEAEATEAAAASEPEAVPAADGAGADDEATMAARLAALPQDASPAEKADAVGSRPVGLGAARGGKADDLKRIRGIGKVNEKKLGDLGVYHFDQIAAWTAAEVRWVGTFLSFAGRIEREEWVAQAARLARGEETDFSKRVDEGDVPSSKD
ncbi:MAG TPA: hypothetical protein PLG99_04540 [Kaistiaceae bacterium]|nr:hypothetical protein [Kaistiaceae bacterium]